MVYIKVQTINCKMKLRVMEFEPVMKHPQTFARKFNSSVVLFEYSHLSLTGKLIDLKKCISYGAVYQLGRSLNFCLENYIAD